MAGSLRVQNGRLLFLGLSQSVAIRPNEWIDYTVQVSRDRNNRGVLTGWINGQQLGSRDNISFGRRNAAHVVKLGLYGGANRTNSAQVVWHDDISIRTTPLGAPAPQPNRISTPTINRVQQAPVAPPSVPAVVDLTPDDSGSLVGAASREPVVGSVSGDSLITQADRPVMDPIRSINGKDIYRLETQFDDPATILSFGGGDAIEINARGFNIARGALGDRFTQGTRATDNSDRFIYNRSTGELFFDRDGANHRFDQQLVATLESRPSLGSENISIV